MGKLRVDCPALIRFGQLTEDEVFVSYDAARVGVTFENHSKRDPFGGTAIFRP